MRYMRDVIVVLPGIMGSVLSRGDSTVWDPGIGMSKRLIGTSKWIDSLKVKESDDPSNPGWLDGIVPTGLAKSQAIIPGLLEIDGYTELDRVIKKSFERTLVEGDPLRPGHRVDKEDPSIYGHPNYFRFAYDWRRDLRASALRLHDLLEVVLGNYRKRQSPDAKVIFIAHSMGGLLARYYLEGTNPRTGESFDGWANVRELLSMGTPYRGAIPAIGHLVNGFKVAFIDFSAALQSYNGVYQLMPRYKAILDQRADAPPAWIYPYEMTGVADFDTGRAKDAFEFHKTIEDGVNTNRLVTTYPRTHCVPVIGFGQGTLNSAELDDNGLKLFERLPPHVPAAMEGGDGTVPAVSAVPLEYSRDRPTVRYLNQKHGAIQTDAQLLAAEVAIRIQRMDSDLAEVAGPGEATNDNRPTLAINHLLFWFNGDPDGELGAAAEFGAAAPGKAAVVLENVPEGATVKLVITNRDTNEQTTHEGLVAGQTVDLPAAAAEYGIEASCRRANLAVKSAFSVLPAEAGS